MGTQGTPHPTGCPKGFYGKQCHKKCHCANRGRCHRLYGACLCDPGLYGRFCHLGESSALVACVQGAGGLLHSKAECSWALLPTLRLGSDCSAEDLGLSEVPPLACGLHPRGLELCPPVCAGLQSVSGGGPQPSDAS